MARALQAYRFAAAAPDEAMVFGAARPGYAVAEVQAWVAFMQGRGIRRVCCLLEARQLARYSDRSQTDRSQPGLLQTYKQCFGDDLVLWAPIVDFQLVESGMLRHQILPFLAAANHQGEAVVVHCSGGVGRTGQVLAAWLVAGRGLDPAVSIATVRQMGRNPYEAAIAAPLMGRSPWNVSAHLRQCLVDCQSAISD
jgi:hypothetical protein